MQLKSSRATFAILFHLVALVTTCSFAADNAPSAKDEKTVQSSKEVARFPLVQTFKLGEESPVFQLQPFYGGEEKQKESPDGVKIQIEIDNPTDKAVDFRNFFDGLILRMKGRNGQSLVLPPYVSRLEKMIVNRVTPLDPKETRLVVPFKIASVFANGKEFTDEDLQPFFFHLQPRGKMKVEIQIQQVVVEKYVAGEEDNPKPVPVPPGIYTVSIQLSLHGPHLKSKSFYVNSREQSKELVIEYGEVPASGATLKTGPN